MEIVFVVDSSGSVGSNNFPSEIKFVTRFLADFHISHDQTRVAFVNFGDAVS